MTMEKLANHIIAVAQDNKTSISNLQLQKIMYFAMKDAKEKQLMSMDELSELYDEPFLVWAYGPVVKSQYDRFKRFGSSPIIGLFQASDDLKKINGTIKEYLSETVSSLVRKSHQVPFWEENKDKIVGFRSNIEYNLEDI
ncbi:Panacea domain-containing protein [Streptococcus parasanguinis]|uniref:Uncharacterized protein n=1 Tax=Streptococcus parasanguinis (strain ATCC 15912 / DSM 6778 / CIP 104372 / LMG 14537) TaxID=760570 RepID=F8DJG2_STREP|nr:type II toxin-antitoxin system antitoxin SocA domain-containing protein [Streptococcus parasanguinis]AEH56023.1 hypothetical protein HMPREF0833_10992 [Streptococcus parasanguinis ATCC 15912]SUN87495.1 phage protein [Streptococcus parasanguinis]